MYVIKILEKSPGGPSSGHFEHKGRPGKVGGSVPYTEGKGPTPEKEIKWKIPKGVNVVWMSPDEYIERINIINREGYTHERIKQEEEQARRMGLKGILHYPGFSEISIKNIKRGIEEGNEIDIPFIQYEKGKVLDQEGFHRALVAREIGIGKIPITIWGDLPNTWEKPLRELSEEVPGVEKPKLTKPYDAPSEITDYYRRSVDYIEYTDALDKDSHTKILSKFIEKHKDFLGDSKVYMLPFGMKNIMGFVTNVDKNVIFIPQHSKKSLEGYIEFWVEQKRRFSKNIPKVMENEEFKNWHPEKYTWDDVTELTILHERAHQLVMDVLEKKIGTRKYNKFESASKFLEYAKEYVNLPDVQKNLVHILPFPLVNSVSIGEFIADDIAIEKMKRIYPHRYFAGYDFSDKKYREERLKVLRKLFGEVW